MKDIFNLTKILLSSSFESKKSNKKNKSKLGKIILYAILFAYIGGIVVLCSYQMLELLIELNQPAMFLKIIIGGEIALTLIRTLFSTVNVLYFSSDIEYLLPLPIKPSKILMAKWNILVISQYLIQIPLVLPSLVLYGIMLNMSKIYYIYAILVFLILPIIPTVLVSVINIITMKFTNFIKNKDFVQYITIAFSLVIVVGVQFINNSSNVITQEQAYAMIEKTNGAVDIASKTFSTITFSLKALMNSDNIVGFEYMLLTIILSFAVYCIFANLLSKLYIEGATGSLTNGIKKSKKINKEVYNGNSIAKSYIIKEFKNLIRNPMYFMQCLMPPVLFPLIVTLPVFFQMKNDSEAMSEFYALKNSFELTPIVTGIVFSVIGILFMFNFIATTAISRDAENATLMKYIPISLRKQTIYKMLPAVIMNIFPIAYISIGFKILFNVEILDLIIFIVLLMLINIVVNYIGIIIDLKNPKLNWTSEHEVVKQNINMFYFMCIIILEIGILVFSAFKVQNSFIYALITFGYLVLQLFVIDKYVSKNENKLYEKIN